MLFEELGLSEYNVTYVPKVYGDYVISILWANQHVPGSPFKSVVLGPPDAAKCVLSGLRLTPKKFDQKVTGIRSNK